MNPRNLDLGSALADCILGHRDLTANMRQFKAAYYEKTFADYRAACASVFADLDETLAAGGDPEQIAEAFIDALAVAWQAESKGGAARQKMLDCDRALVAIYLVPALRVQGFSGAEDFCEILQRTWVRRYPKTPFYLGTYEGISGSFKKRLCFITTAICQAGGKGDDCPELGALRAFRDGWLSQNPGGGALIREYYEIAPVIVTLMSLCGDFSGECDRLRRDYLKPCLQSLEAGRPGECRDGYVRMVRELEEKYLLFGG